MKKIMSTFLTLLLACSTFALATPAHAYVVDIVDNSDERDYIVQGNLQLDFGDDIHNVYVLDEVNSPVFVSNTADAMGQLTLHDGGLRWSAQTCVYGAAVETPEGDTIQCDAQTPDNAYSDLSVTPQFRVSAPNANGVVLARVLYEINNPTIADVTIGSVSVEARWDEYDDYSPLLTNNGAGFNDDKPNDWRWVNTADYEEVGAEVVLDASNTSFGFAWRGPGINYFATMEEPDDTISDDEEINPESLNVVVPANESIYLAFFGVYAYNDSVDSTLIEDTNSFMSVFDGSFSACVLAAGIDVGTNVLNWGVVTDCGSEPTSPAPVIANGYSPTDIGSVYFTPGSSKLSKAAKASITKMVAANPSAIYKVTGYVQKSATSSNDASLSLARAKAVEKHLASIGAGVNFTVVIETGKIPAKKGDADKARRATLFAMTPVVL